MALVSDQAILTVTAKGTDVGAAVDRLKVELDAYPQARITSLTHHLNPWGGFRATITVIAVIEYDSSSADPR